MRKSSTILEELNENKELAKATGLAADEKDFIEGEIADLEKEYEAALEAEKKAQKPKKKETEPEIIVTVGTKKTGKATPIETPATEKPKKAKKAPKTQDEMAFIVYKGKKIYENEPEYCEKSIEAWKERKAAQKKAAGKYKTKPVIQKVASNIVSAVAKGIDTIKHEDIKGNPKEAIEKMEQLEKAGKQFLEAYKNILGEKISDKAIKEEFEGLDETIKKISEKYLAEKTKFESGGQIDEKKYPKFISNDGDDEYNLVGTGTNIARIDDVEYYWVTRPHQDSKMSSGWMRKTPKMADGGEVENIKSLAQIKEEIDKLKFTPANFVVSVAENAYENTNDPYNLDTYSFNNVTDAYEKYKQEVANIKNMYAQEVPDYKEIELQVWDEDNYEMEILDSQSYNVSYDDDYGKLVIQYQHVGKGMNYAHKFIGLFFLDKYTEKDISNNPDKMFSTWTSILDITKDDLDGLTYEEAVEKITDEANLKLQNSISLDDISSKINLAEEE